MMVKLGCPFGDGHQSITQIQRFWRWGPVWPGGFGRPMDGGTVAELPKDPKGSKRVIWPAQFTG